MHSLKILTLTLVSIAVLLARPVAAQDFTIEINRGQADAVTLSTPKTSPNGLALTWVFDKHNADLIDAGEPPLASEPVYLRDAVLLSALRSWRRQQLNVGVVQAYADANEATKAAVRAELGLP